MNNNALKILNDMRQCNKRYYVKIHKKKIPFHSTLMNAAI